jgi:hypothetical protein
VIAKRLLITMPNDSVSRFSLATDILGLFDQAMNIKNRPKLSRHQSTACREMHRIESVGCRRSYNSLAIATATFAGPVVLFLAKKKRPNRRRIDCPQNEHAFAPRHTRVLGTFSQVLSILGGAQQLDSPLSDFPNAYLDEISHYFH